MSYTKSKHFIKSKLREETSLVSAQSEFERDDDDPLSIRSLSITSLGIIFALLTFLLPSISILIGRPFSLGNEIIFNHNFEKDDDDPLSIRSLSITSLGIIFAFLTIFLPSISILIGRPLSQGNEIIHNHDFKKDGP